VAYGCGGSSPPFRTIKRKAPLVGLFYEALINADSEFQPLLSWRERYPT